jgi:curved DNA-binding protein CbpA
MQQPQIRNIEEPVQNNENGLDAKYKFFGLTKSSTLEDLKNSYRKIVLKYHPDRNGGDSQIFDMIQQNYREIEDEIKKSNKNLYNKPVVPQTYDDNINQGQQNIYIDREKFSIDKFNQVFNQFQSGLHSELMDPNQRGYGDFMDTTQRRSAEDPILNNSTIQPFEDNEESNEIKDLMVYREPEILYSGQGLSFIELGQNQINDFGGYDARGNNRYMDYKKAYFETLEQLYFKTREIEERDRAEEQNLRTIEHLKSIIQKFDESVDLLEGVRKENAIKTLKSLYFVFNRLGSVYLDELAARKKSFKLQKENL